MTEMQGAIGGVQLRKLSTVMNAQYKFFKNVEELISKNKNYEMKIENTNGSSSYDAVLVKCKNSNSARAVRDKMVQNGFSTKILPEAVSWHYAGDFNHVKELKIVFKDDEMRKLLGKYVALPTFCNQPDGYQACLEKVFQDD
tara:strand:+ start:55 stop:480 length:426 start_codon:yes stop_codon:yes gene_type:complete